MRALGAAALVISALAVIVPAGSAGAITRVQSAAGWNVNCALNGLHQNTGPVSTCHELTIETKVLVNGVDVAPGTTVAVGDVITTRLTVVPQGGSNAFYQETADGIWNNNNGSTDLRFALDIDIPAQTGSRLSAPANVQMSRTDQGDRSSAPLINCLAQNGQESFPDDPLTPITLGGAAVGATKMNAALAGTTLTARWDEMAVDRCVTVLSNNGYYAGHVVEFQQTVQSVGTTPEALTWNFGQVRMERRDGSRQILWGSDADATLNLVPAAPPANPVGVADGGQVDAHYTGQSNTSTSINVLANDTGAGTLEITAVSPTTAGGTVSCGALPSTQPCTYTPPENFSGTDTFTYTVTDDNGTDTVQVVVNVLPDAAPDADDDLATTTMGTAVSGDVRANDVDPDGDGMVVDTTPVVPPANGTLVLRADGTFTYTPNAGFFGTDSFTYEVCGVHNLLPFPATSERCATAKVTIAVSPGKSPSAVGDVGRTDVDDPLTIDVLANDDAGDGGPVTITAAGIGGQAGTTLAGGTVTCAATCTYTPAAGFSGTDAFTYTITDQAGRTSSATVVVEVVGNLAPVALDDSVSATQDGPAVTGSLSGNDRELEGEHLTYDTTPVTAPTKGTVVIAADGTYTYTPNAGASGTDTFTYEVCDDHVTVAGAARPACSQATVTVTITATPIAPVEAVMDFGDTDTDVPIDIDVLANDDPSGAAGALTVVSAGFDGIDDTTLMGGNVTCAATCPYTPPPGYSGIDVFSYTVRGANGAEATAMAYIYVVGNQPPVPADDFGITPVDTAFKGNLSPNDIEPDDEGLIYTAEPSVAPKHGTVVINDDGTYTYTPDAGYVGKDTFTYQVCDDHTLVDGTDAPACSEATATLLIGMDKPAPTPKPKPVDPPHHKPAHGGGGSLARTGMAVGGFTAVGFGTLLAGAAVLELRRRRLVSA